MIVLVDGQTRATWPIRSKSGANILPESIDQCKGYSAFAYLVLVPPCYVLSEAAMLVASDESHLKDYLNSNADKMSRSLAVSKVVVNAREIEFDSLVKDGAISIYATRQARPRTLWRRPVQQLFRMPKDMVLISLGNQDIKHEFAEGARILQELVSM
ncbi:uncharacterized protein PITG_12089 [Phytophthora infestans T30-4]|uniref:Uncharacterized protein n=1 Tax=Phytophthora infestans (strain T30-4) TaxID=403677 RepID=D0NJ07_PHYIT|nr:uncharacterized protein PITG_12089 [Phytophthora infestans T30-4]EEY59525.1 conserved hypothetical protein [Phytophthora infestans T30-4]|eukprot:XP_002900718.1 conserved hypothetical protein [Phytophthora infestans T30-4]